MENPEADIDTSGLDEYINIAKKSKSASSLMKSLRMPMLRINKI
jgi:hypothetical protein